MTTYDIIHQFLLDNADKYDGLCKDGGLDCACWTTDGLRFDGRDDPCCEIDCEPGYATGETEVLDGFEFREMKRGPRPQMLLPLKSRRKPQ